MNGENKVKEEVKVEEITENKDMVEIDLPSGNKRTMSRKQAEERLGMLKKRVTVFENALK